MNTTIRMNQKSMSDMVANCIGGAIGMVLGLVIGTLIGVGGSTVQFFVTLICMGVVGLAVGAMTVATYRQMRRSEAAGESTKGARIVIASCVGFVAGFTILIAYLNEVPGADAWQRSTVFIIGFLAAGAATYLSITGDEGQLPISQRKPVAVVDEHNYMGKRISNYLGVIGKNDERVEYAARFPFFTGFASQGISIPGACLCIWGFYHFPGHKTIEDNIHRGNTEFTIALSIFALLVIIWITLGLLELRSYKIANTSSTDADSKMLWLRRLIITVIVVVVILAWFYLEKPWLGWFVYWAKHDPLHFLIFGIIGFAVWSLALFAIYLTSYHILTDKAFYAGSKFTAGRESQRSMPLEKVTELKLDRELHHRGFNYSVLKAGGMGNVGSQWNDQRVRKGQVLKRLLAGQTR